VVEVSTQFSGLAVVVNAKHIEFPVLIELHGNPPQNISTRLFFRGRWIIPSLSPMTA
jgi:hypothetical protein